MSSDDLGRRLEELAGPVRRQVRPPELATLHRLARRRRRRLAGTTTGMAVALAAVAAVGVGLVPEAPAGRPPAAEPSFPEPLPRSQFGGVQTTEPAAPPTTAPAAGEATAASRPGPSPAAAPTTTPATRTVKVFFWARLGPEGRCVAPVARTRRVPVDAPVRRALRQLLLGPTDHERSRGLSAAFQDAADALGSLRVEDGTAHVDFADLSGLALDPPGTPCRAAKVVRPLDATLRQFSWVERTRYTLRGSGTAFQERLGVQPTG